MWGQGAVSVLPRAPCAGREEWGWGGSVGARQLWDGCRGTFNAFPVL